MSSYWLRPRLHWVPHLLDVLVSNEPHTNTNDHLILGLEKNYIEVWGYSNHCLEVSYNSRIPWLTLHIRRVSLDLGRWCDKTHLERSCDGCGATGLQWLFQNGLLSGCWGNFSVVTLVQYATGFCLYTEQGEKY